MNRMVSSHVSKMIERGEDRETALLIFLSTVLYCRVRTKPGEYLEIMSEETSGSDKSGGVS